jgi:formylglycine-generating enzyme required for sulfatase activity
MKAALSSDAHWEYAAPGERNTFFPWGDEAHREEGKAAATGSASDRLEGDTIYRGGSNSGNQ